MVGKNGSVQSLVCVGLGAAFGLIAATSQFTAFTSAADSYRPGAIISPAASAVAPALCCADGLAKTQLLALADREPNRADEIWAIATAGPFIAEHLKSLEEFPPSQGADTLSMKKALDETMKKLESSSRGKN